MVSGLVTSPCDQLRIFSGDASMMRMASKSVIGLVSSNGFERNKATLLGKPYGTCRGNSRDFLRALPSREAVFAAFKKNPEQKLLAAGSQLGAPGLDSETWDTSNLSRRLPPPQVWEPS